MVRRLVRRGRVSAGVVDAAPCAGWGYVVVELLVLRGVSVGFERGRGRLGVLCGVSLSLGVGEVGAVVGGRSQGKTTLLRVVAGMVGVDEGVVCFGGSDLVGFSERERARLLGVEIAWAGRGGPGGLRMRVEDYVGLPLVRGLGLRQGEPRRRALAALERVGAGGCVGLQWQALSDWERVLVELAQGIVGGPRLLLVDDLLSGLSMGRVREAMRLLGALAGEQGFGVLLVCDGEAALLADRVWLLEGGELSAIDEPAPAGETVIPFPERRSSLP